MYFVESCGCRLLDDYLAAVDGITKHLLRYTHPNKYAFLGTLHGTTFGSDMVSVWQHYGIT